MKKLAWLIPAALGAALAVASLAGGCKGSDSPAEDTGVRCTPGNYVFCRCANREEGTKLCNPDGKSFQECRLPGDVACPGGEAPTNDAGVPIDDAGNPEPLPDTCPGAQVVIDPNAKKVVEGDTSGSKGDYDGRQGACGVAGGSPDNVYEIVTTATGRLKIEVQGLAPFDPTVYLRRTCDDVESQASCGETTGPGGTETLNVDIVTGQKHYLFIDGKGGSKGRYTITFTLTPGGFCGDGKIQSGEACDDGNKVDDDGCSPDCKKVNGNPTSMNSCPGQPVDVWPGAIVTGTGSTENAAAGTFGQPSTVCTKGSTNSANDHVYAVTVHKTGTLYVSTSLANYNFLLAARRNCTDPTSWDEPPANQCPASGGVADKPGMCANCRGASAPFDETMLFPVTDGQTYAVAVSGGLTAKGTYTVAFEVK